MCVTRFSLNHIKVLAVLIMALVCVNVSLAEKVNADAAYRIATEFFSSPASRSAGKLSLAYTCPEDAAYYVFNAEAADGGFVVVAGDDAVTPILGYSDVATFDPTNIPPALQWKLDSYKAEIAAAASKGIKVVASRSASPDKAPIAPLITTQWGQSAPYNNLCPEIDGKRCYTGCVATALAQIINYHKCPNQGIGTFSYVWNKQPLSFDYSEYTIHWDNMAESYRVGIDYSKENADAVAELMLACGIGVAMSYSTVGSGSDIPQSKRFLVENLNYNPEMRVAYIHNYSPEDWSDILYNELFNRRPILCAGKGHAFVCDGYDGDGYFHYNWGWDGSDDGYFLPTLLNPTTDASYHHDEAILTGVKKNEIGRIYYTPDLICKGDFKVNARGEAEVGPLQNYSTKQFDGYLGIKIICETTCESTFYEFDGLFTIKRAEGWLMWASSPHSNLPKKLNLKSGKYKAYPVYRTTDGDWNSIRCFFGRQDHLLLDVDNNGMCIFSNIKQEPTADSPICVKRISVNEDGDSLIYANMSISITALFHNSIETPLRPEIEMRLLRDQSSVYSTVLDFIIEGQEEMWYSTNIGSDIYSIDEGDYEVEFYDAFGHKLHNERFTFTVQSEPVPDLSLLGFKVNEPDQDTYNFIMIVKNNSNVQYHSPFRIDFSGKDGTNYSQTRLWPTASGVETTIPIYVNNKFYTFLAGEEYTVCVYDCKDKMIHDAPIRFTFPGGDGSGIEAPEVDGWDADAPVEYYDLQGRKVANPTTGLYIARQGALTRKVFIR